VIDDGFFYDFSYKRPFTPDDLLAIEKKMAELVKADLKVERKVLSRSDAITFFKVWASSTRRRLSNPFPATKICRCTPGRLH